MAIENISPSEFEGIKNDFASGGFEQKLANLENVLLYEQGDLICLICLNGYAGRGALSSLH